MPNVCLEVDGAHILQATSCDPEHPPENILDGKEETFWCTTGLYPQELIVSFPNNMRIMSLEMRSAAVGNIVIQRSQNPQPRGWEDLASAQLTAAEGQIQIEDFQIQPSIVRHLRLIIKSGHEPFCAIYSLKAEGTPVEDY